MSINYNVFDDFFGRRRNSSLPLSSSLDDASYRKLHTQYANEIGSKWGVGSVPTAKGFEKWLQKKVKDAER